MSALADRITEVLTGFRVDPSPAVCGCFDLTPEDAAHVAERIESELQPEHDRELAQAWNAGFKEGMKVRI